MGTPEAERDDRTAREALRATVMPLRRRIPGVRALAFALTSLVGGAGVLVGTGAVGVGLVAIAIQLGGAIVPIAALAVPFVGLAAFVYGSHLLGGALQRAEKLSSPWGELAAGSDGVRWDGWVRRRFVAWRDVTKIATDRDAVVLKLRSGGSVRLLASAPDELARALKRARRRYRHAPRESAPATLLSITDAASWMDGARAHGDESYRAGSSPELLVRVLEDPDVAPLARAGAALALKRAGAHAARMRIAREASADEELIQALQAIEDDALTVAHVKRLARRS